MARAGPGDRELVSPAGCRYSVSGRDVHARQRRADRPSRGRARPAETGRRGRAAGRIPGLRALGRQSERAVDHRRRGRGVRLPQRAAGGRRRAHRRLRAVDRRRSRVRAGRRAAGGGAGAGVDLHPPGRSDAAVRAARVDARPIRQPHGGRVRRIAGAGAARRARSDHPVQSRRGVGACSRHHAGSHGVRAQRLSHAAARDQPVSRAARHPLRRRRRAESLERDREQLRAAQADVQGDGPIGRDAQVSFPAAPGHRPAGVVAHQRVAVGGRPPLDAVDADADAAGHRRAEVEPHPASRRQDRRVWNSPS